MRRFLILAVALGAGAAVMLLVGRTAPADLVLFGALCLLVGWYAERARNWAVVLKATKKAIPDYRRSLWRARIRFAVVVLVLVLAARAGFSKEG